MPVSGPMAADFLVPGDRLVSNAEIEAVAEPVGAGGIEVDMNFVEPGMPNTSRGPDTPSYEV